MDRIEENIGKTRAGFTLIELLVVIAVIGILVGIGFGVSRSVEERRNISRAQTELGILVQALEQYRSQYGDYPWVASTTPEEGYRTLYRALNGRQGPQGAQIQGRTFLEHDRFELFDRTDLNAAGNHLLDPWGRPYRYHYRTVNNPDDWEHSGYLLFSTGPSGIARSNYPGPDGRPDYDDADNRDNIYAHR